MNSPSNSMVSRGSDRHAPLNHPLVIGTLVAVALFLWLVILPHHPYAHSWLYRTLVQPGFNEDVTVKLEFDGKPYSIHRVLRCRKDLRAAHFFLYDLFDRNPAHWPDIRPDFSSFGIKADTGEGIIISLPNICTSSYRKITGLDLTDWTMDVPSDYLPTISVADNAADPKEIIAYVSRQAYTSPHARIAYKGLEVKALRGFQDWSIVADTPDQFAFFGMPNLFYDTSAAADWHTVAFAVLPKEVWQDPTSHVSLLQRDTLAIRTASTPTYLDSPVFFGLEDTPIFRDLTAPRNELATNRQAANAVLLESILPFRLNNNVWEPAFDERGRVILSSPTAFEDNSQLESKPQYLKLYTNDHRWSVYSRQIRLGSDLFAFEILAGTGPHPTPSLSDNYHTRFSHPLFLPKTSSIYVPFPSPVTVYPTSSFK